MKKRPLCAICVLFLLVQSARIILSGAEAYGVSALGRCVEEESEAQAQAEVRLDGTVIRIEEKKKVTAVFLEDCAVSVPGRVIREPEVLVYVRPDQNPQNIKIGNILRVTGEAELFERARNPGNFDQRAYYAKMGLYVLVWAERAESLAGNVKQPEQFLYEVKCAWNDLLLENLGSYYGGTMSALLLGVKSGLDPDMKKSYQKNGISHLLAISGLHMSFIGMGLYRLLRRMGLGFLPSGLCGGCILIAYSVMIGTGASSMRALIMFLVRMGAEVTGRDYDLPTSLALAAAILCGIQPLYLTDAAFLLSFGAILGIALLTPVFGEMLFCGEVQKKRKRQKEKAGKSVRKARKRERLKLYALEGLGWTLNGLSSSLAVSALLLGPLLYFYFELPPYSVFLNLLVIPVMPAAFGAGIFGSGLCLVSEAAGGAVFFVCRAVLLFYDAVCGASGALPGSRFVTGKPEIIWIAVYYGGILLLRGCFALLTAFRERKGRFQSACRIPGIAVIVLAAVMSFVCRLGYEKADGVTAAVLDVGQGDGIFIRSAEAACLIDGGSSDISSVGSYRIEPYLLSNAADTLDYVFVTHGDEDHISGVAELLAGQELGVRIRCLVLPPEEYHDEKLTALAATAEANGTRVLAMEAGDEITWEREEKDAGEYDLSITCLGPEKDAGLKPGNEASLVLRIEYGAFDMLLTGDVEGAGEECLLESGRLGRADVLKAAHHGSKNSGSEAFLEAVNPKIAVISAGVGNRYGHPHEETLERLRESGCTVYSTQDTGAVIIHTDGESLFLP